MNRSKPSEPIAPVKRPAPMTEVVRLAQAYKQAPHGPESERALYELCSCVERIVVHREVRDILNGNF